VTANSGAADGPPYVSVVMPGYRNRASLSELAARAYAALDGAYPHDHTRRGLRLIRCRAGWQRSRLTMI
jgi:hypothetical protein